MMSWVRHASIRRCLDASIVCACVRSLALAITVAFDYGVIRSVGTLWAAPYWLTLAALVTRAFHRSCLGIFNLNSHFVLGTLRVGLGPCSLLLDNW
jgi:hypothetical protein